MQMNTPQSTVAWQKDHVISLQGAGAAAPTVLVGQRIAIARVAIGRYTVTWSDPPGYFVGFGYALGDPTQSNVKGWTVTRGVPSVVGGLTQIEIDVWNSTFAAADLATTSQMDLLFTFKERSV